MSTISADAVLAGGDKTGGFLPRIANPASYRGLALPLLLLVLWEVSSRQHWINPTLLSSPSSILRAGFIALTEGELWHNVQLSLSRMVLGWLAGALVGLSFGTLIGLSKTFDRILGPSLHAFRQIAPFAWIPLISVWFGLGDSAKIAFIALVVFFPSLINTYEGIRGTPRELIEVGRAFTFSPFLMIRRVVLPAATPAILNGLELGFLYAWLATLGAEYLMNATGGLGSIMESAQESLEMDTVFLGVIISGLVGFSISLTVRLTRARLLRWRRAFN